MRILRLLPLLLCGSAWPAVASPLFVSPWTPEVLPSSPATADSAPPLTFRLPPEHLPARFRGRCLTQRPVALEDKVIALTFDDGPDPDITPAILDTLARYHARSTFFVVGERGKRWPDLIQREARSGHAVESHSFSHPSEDVNLWHAGRELQRAGIVITQWTGRAPTLFRPPWGNTEINMARVARQRGQCVVKWTLCAGDNPRLTAAEIVEAVTRNPRPGDIVLLHDGRDRQQTVRALPEVLRRLSDAGYRFITVPQLLRRWDSALTREERRHARRPIRLGHHTPAHDRSG